MTSNLDEKGLRSIFDKYDVFFIDIWGVLHNGLNLFKNSVEVLEKLEKNNFTISLPVTEKNNNMDFYEWSFKDLLKVSNRGIPEPIKKNKVYPDILIVPLVGFDNNKFRLGYGGGFYDRYISKILNIKKFITIGFAFSFQETFKIPKNKFDQKLDIILTNKSIVK